MFRMAMAGGVLLLMVSGAAAQRRIQRGANNNNQPITPPNVTQPGVLPPLDDPSITDGGLHARMDAERMKSANDDRHKRLESDVDKLLSLTNELKADLSKTTKDELSLDVVRKAQEIEKLAHDVQNRMKN